MFWERFLFAMTSNGDSVMFSPVWSSRRGMISRDTDCSSQLQLRYGWVALTGPQLCRYSEVLNFCLLGLHQQLCTLVCKLGVSCWVKQFHKGGWYCWFNLLSSTLVPGRSTMEFGCVFFLIWCDLVPSLAISLDVLPSLSMMTASVG